MVDLPVGGGKVLGVKALECYVKVPWAGIGLTYGTRLLESLADLRRCFAETVNEEVKRLEVTRPNDPNLRRLKGLSRLLWAVEVTNWTQQILDSVLLDKPLMDLNRAVAYLGYTAREPPPRPCPVEARCLADITADLDGDRQPDHIGLYVSGERKAARAVLATGSVSTLAVEEEDIPGLARAPMEPTGVLDADGDGRDEAIIRTGTGGNTFYPVGILKLDGTHLVLVGEDQSAQPPSFTVDGGLFHGAGFRCGPIGADGKPRLTVTEVQHEYVDAPVDPGRWAWKTCQYRWRGAALVLEHADAGTLTLGPNVDSQDPRLAQYYGIHCKTR
jgi:hypothetical protein